MLPDMVAPSIRGVRGLDDGEAPLDDQGDHRRKREREHEPRRPGAPAGGAMEAVLAVDGFLQQGRQAVDGLAPGGGAPDPFGKVRRRARHGGDLFRHGVDTGGHAALHVVELGLQATDQGFDIGRRRRGPCYRRPGGFGGLRLPEVLLAAEVPLAALELFLDPPVLVAFRHGFPCFPVAPGAAIGYAVSR